MPNVIGMPLIDALPLLENMGLKVEVKGSGKVTKQSIKKGTKIKDIKKVTLQLSQTIFKNTYEKQKTT